MLKIRNDVNIDDNQSVFNRVWQYFIVEGHPYGYDFNSGSCCYIDSNDNRCAVGCLFTRESLRQKRKESSNRVVIGPVASQFLKEELGKTTPDYFISELQGKHDACATDKSTLSEFENELVRLASKYNLTVPE